ncbi:MAG: RING finger protein [Acutalibacteraceae bacterium]|nr:RING finger protein [Acutalibacteraceae bacterium]
MSFNVEGEKCPVCGAYLFNEDDLVFCPTCGAPHHRDCYQSVGRCALEHLHGTADQYKRIEKEEPPIIEEVPPTLHTDTVQCGMCGEEYDRNADACPDCATPNVTKMGGKYVRFDFLGGVPADMDLGQGVTADEAKRFVLSNTHRYIPKFAAMRGGKHLSWNWLAFIFPCGWFLSRKMYALGGLAGAISVALSLFSIPFNRAIVQFDLTGGYMEISRLIAENIESIGVSVIALAAIGGLLNIVFSFLCGMFGDLLYRNHTIDTVSHIKQESVDLEEDFRSKGGVSLIALLIGWAIVQYLPRVFLIIFGI